jgi:hypothetical protein
MKRQPVVAGASLNGGTIAVLCHLLNAKEPCNAAVKPDVQESNRTRSRPRNAASRASPAVLFWNCVIFWRCLSIYTYFLPPVLHVHKPGQMSRTLAALSEISEDALLDVHLHLRVRCRKSCTLQSDADVASCKSDLQSHNG